VGWDIGLRGSFGQSFKRCAGLGSDIAFKLAPFMGADVKLDKACLKGFKNYTG
jgi:hypothetical protein